MNFKKILLLDNLPYLLSLLFLSIGWAITHISDKIEKFPLIEFNQRLVRTDTVLYEYTISNITSDKLFKNIDFTFNYRNNKGDSIIEAVYKGVPPASFPSEAELNPVFYKLPISNFQPGTTLKVSIVVSSKEPPILTFQSAEKVMLVESSFLTWLYKNNLYLFLFLIFLWSVLIILYLNEYSKKRPKLNRFNK